MRDQFFGTLVVGPGDLAQDFPRRIVRGARLEIGDHALGEPGALDDVLLFQSQRQAGRFESVRLFRHPLFITLGRFECKHFLAVSALFYPNRVTPTV